MFLKRNLNHLLRIHQLSGIKLAKATGVHPSSIKQIRTGTNTNPTISTLLPLAKYFRLSVEALVSDDLTYLTHDDAESRQKEASKKIPLLHWHHIKNPTHECEYLAVNTNYSDKSFAITLESEYWWRYREGGVVIIEPAFAPEHNDYVLTRNRTTEQHDVKQLLVEDAATYLKSINIDLHITPFDENQELLGVVCEYQHILKAPTTTQQEAHSHLNEINKDCLETI